MAERAWVRELAQVAAAGEANRAAKCGAPTQAGGIVAWSARLPQSSRKRTPNPLDVSAAVEVLVCAHPKGAHMPRKRTQRKTTNKTRRRTKKAGRTSLLNAAAAVLAKTQESMTCPEMVEAVLKTGTWKTRGKTPAATLSAAIYREIQDKGKEARFAKSERGRFRLRGARRSTGRNKPA